MKDKVIKLRKGRLGRLRPNHPWVYKRQIREAVPSIKPGEIISVINSDAFFYLRNIYNLGERFDIIIIDPPSFAKDRRSVIGAAKGYKELNLTAMKALNEGSVLATFSCSHHISNELFSDILKQAARDAKKRFEILKRCRQAEDHPIVKSIPETEYLKGYFLKVFSKHL